MWNTDKPKLSPGFIGVLVYAGLIAPFYFWRIQSFLKDVLIAPVFFLVPTGVGLFLLSLLGSHKTLLSRIPRLPLILSATFVGFTFIPTIYFRLLYHNVRLPGTLFDSLYPLILFCALTGFYRTQDLFQITPGVRSLAKSLLPIFPIFLILYYFHYVHFSPFPLRDIFQEVHFMKGALEMSRFQIINIATGDAYLPMLQVFLGLLYHFFAYDLIHSQWILPVYIYFLHILAFYCFYRTWITDVWTLRAALALAAIYVFTYFSNTNNEYLVAFTLILFSILASLHRDLNGGWVFAKIAALTALSVVAYVQFKWSHEAPILSYLVGSLVIFHLATFTFGVRALSYLFPLFLMVWMPAYHRAAALYVPLVFILYGLYFALFQSSYFSKERHQIVILKKFLWYSCLCPVLAGALWFMLYQIWPDSFCEVTRVIDKISFFLVRANSKTAPSIINCIANWLRLAPPLLYGACGWLFFEVWRLRTEPGWKESIHENLGGILFALLSTTLMMLLYFSPLPLIQRLTPFPALCFLYMPAVMGRFYHRFYFEKARLGLRFLQFPSAMVLGTLGTCIVYNLQWKPLEYVAQSPYVQALSPLPGLFFGVAVGLLLLLVVKRANRFSPWLVYSIIVLCLFLDRFHIFAKSYGPAYGYDLPKSKVISHYTKLELESARKLHSMYHEGDRILLSDPASIGLFGALTGWNGLFSFANLSTIQEHLEKPIKAVFREAFPSLEESPSKNAALDPEKNFKILQGLANYIRKEGMEGAVPEANYALHTFMRLPFWPQNHSDDISWAEFMKGRFIWILNEKTVRWAHERVGYYPMNTPFSEEYLQRHVYPYFDVLLNKDNVVLILKMK